LQKTLENEREERRDVTQTKEELFGRPPRCCMQLVPQSISLSCKISKQKLAGNAAKTPILVTEIFCVYTENFQQRYLI
jgi:hypothetical protein